MSDDGCAPLFAIVLMLSIFFLWLGATVGREHGKHIVRTEAVQRGIAEWVVDDQGKTEWRWKE